MNRRNRDEWGKEIENEEKKEMRWGKKQKERTWICYLDREKQKGEKITAADTLLLLGLTMQGSVPEKITDSLRILIY